MSTSTCIPCLSLDCDFPSDLELYSLDGLQYFLNGRFYFVLDCPPGYDCYDFPVPWVIPEKTLPKLYIPPDTPPGIAGFPLRLRCCGKDVIGHVPAGASQAVLQGVAQSMFQQCALLQAQCDAIKTFGLRPKSPPFQWTPISGSPCLNVNTQLTFAVVVSVPSVTFALIAGSLPPGMTLVQISAKGCAIRGTATATGSYTFRVRAQYQQYSSTKQYTISVMSISNALTMPDASVGVDYATVFGSTLVGAGGVGPYTFAADLTEIPLWLAFNPDGTVTTGSIPGPGDIGSFTFGVTITDSTGAACFQNVTLDVTQHCNWGIILSALGTPAGDISANPAWNGVFDHVALDSSGNPVHYFIAKSIKGLKASADDGGNGYPVGTGWVDFRNFTSLYWDGSDWYFDISMCNHGSYWVAKGPNTPGNPVGNYSYNSGTIQSFAGVSVSNIGPGKYCVGPSPCPDWSTILWASTLSANGNAFATATPLNTTGAAYDVRAAYLVPGIPFTGNYSLATNVGAITYNGHALGVLFTGNIVWSGDPGINYTVELTIRVTISGIPTPYILFSYHFSPPSGPFSIPFTIPDTGGTDALIEIIPLVSCNNVVNSLLYDCHITGTVSC